MRAIFFSNYYLHGIQTGIQAGHAMDNLWGKAVDSYFVYNNCFPILEKESNFLNILRNFNNDHKTFIILNGGDHNALHDLISCFEKQTEYPFAYATEPGLNNAVTSVVIIVPEKLYNDDAKKLSEYLNSNKRLPGTGIDDYALEFTDFELDFLIRKSRCKLAQ